MIEMKEKKTKEKEDALPSVAPTTQGKTPSHNTYNSILPNLYTVCIDAHSYRSQPTKRDMAIITERFKDNKQIKQYTIQEILEKAGTGHSIVPCQYEVISREVINDKGERKIKRNIQYTASNLILLDIDDDLEKTYPLRVCNYQSEKILGTNAAGLFYTFNHEIKGNRYRLVFVLDRLVTNEKEYKAIIELVAEKLSNGLTNEIVTVEGKHPKLPIRGGVKGHEYNSEHGMLSVDALLEEIREKESKQQKVQYKTFKNNAKVGNVAFEQYKEMANFIGYLPSKNTPYDYWFKVIMPIKHHTNSGYFTETEGYELYSILSGPESDREYWNDLEPKGGEKGLKIGTFIKLAQEKGYKFPVPSPKEAPKTYIEEAVSVGKFLTTDIAIKYVSEGGRILVNSPTGSGKTTAFINGFKSMEKTSNHFYLFAAPTIAVTMQVAKEHGIPGIKGQTENLFRMINTHIKNGQNVFVSTYDMLPVLLEIIESIRSVFSFTLVVDEVHKFVTDYDKKYRYEAIKNLYEATTFKNCKGYIALSGTIKEVNKNDFDKVVYVDNSQPSSPCKEVKVYTYKSQKDASLSLAQILIARSKVNKLLVFIQSKDEIRKAYEILRKKGIVTRVLTASSKSNPTFKSIVDTKKVDSKIQVILTTSVIADGVSIDNDEGWETIVVSNHFSKLYDPSLHKQMSNRFRNPYNRYSIVMQESKTKDTYKFHFENRFIWRLETAERLTNAINNHVYFDRKLFLRSKIEQRFGIMQGNDDFLEVDKLFLRHSVSIDQEFYFAKYRDEFVAEVGNILHVTEVGRLEVSELTKDNSDDTNELNMYIEELKEAAKLDKQSKAAAIGHTFTEEAFQAFKEDNTKLLQEFKQAVIPSHYACIQALSNITDYPTCKKVVCNVKRDADTHAFYNAIRDYSHVTYLQRVNRPSPTKSVLNELLQLSQRLENEEYSKELKRIAKKYGFSINDVKAVESMCLIESRKTNGKRYKRITGLLTLDEIAQKYQVSMLHLQRVIDCYAKNHSSTFAKVLKIGEPSRLTLQTKRHEALV